MLYNGGLWWFVGSKGLEPLPFLGSDFKTDASTIPPTPHIQSRIKSGSMYDLALDERSGVVGLDNVEQVALLGDVELGEGLIQIACGEGCAIKVHCALGVVNACVSQDGTQGGGRIDDNGLALEVITYNYLNHNFFSFNSYFF